MSEMARFWNDLMIPLGVIAALGAARFGRWLLNVPFDLTWSL